ncbi:hypothetical protein [Xenorhabdus kozodoii]|uniref:Transposase n=1 Tax=Xenorhabdus kozodoii TaxID=351676 RepID=A0A2D0LFL2_9GAMM|nr:transposase [Xenorhabdus kozodoii]
MPVYRHCIAGNSGDYHVCGAGKPGKDKQPKRVHYQLAGQVYTRLDNVKLARLRVGMFILATNEWDEEQLDMAALLANYKAQQKGERIEALLMVMTCCLMVYAA